MDQRFELQSSYKPSGDQPQAIASIIEGLEKGQKNITLLGATGTGKTFTMANIIQELQVPTLVISHNKTLAAQLATEFKHFFPNNAVHYFVSYFDYYQPESYLPDKDIYIEKEATVNAEIEMYRLSTMASLLNRKDTIVVSSVSALYGLGDKEFFQKYSLYLEQGKSYNHKELKKKLIEMRYEQVHQKIEPGMFDSRGHMRDIFPSTEKVIYRLHFMEDHLEHIERKDSLTRETLSSPDHIQLRPSSQYMQDLTDVTSILVEIEKEMEERVQQLLSQGKDLEANRLKKRTLYDMRMIKETGFVNGIENYSMYFEHRAPGDTPNTIFDYFPDGCLIIMDESHMSVPQLRSMPSADRTRKYSLVEHGFRLPSAMEHRPLAFEELECMIGWKQHNLGSLGSNNLQQHIKPHTKTIFVSATPSKYELELSESIVEQIIRPTGLLDPVTTIYPKSGDYELLLSNFRKTLDKKPYLDEFLHNYDEHYVKDVFAGEDISSVADIVAAQSP
ncbi:MAG: DEAD/DEAH box helicase family protein [Candidatus Absconditabacterales bacterium]